MIRPFNPVDEDELIGVFLASTIPGQSFLPEAHWRGMEPEISRLIPVSRIWVIIDGRELVAFISVQGDLIGGQFTHPDHQGRGHGRALIGHVRRCYDPLFVEVFQANVAALSFYRNLGFVDHAQHIDEATGLPLLILRLGGTDRPSA
jgi:putative acetyltransferase